jgi:predicted metal-binding membrane protein
VNTLASHSRTTILLLGAAVAAWALTAERMRGMDAGPGTDLGGLGWYLGIWAAMSAAMMLPSAAPVVLRLSGGRPAAPFAVGYLTVWIAYGLGAYGLFRLITALGTGWLAWDRTGPYVVGSVIVAAGIYELTPLKRRFLDRCRTPAGPSGLAYGMECVGCCFGLMAVLFALGVMSILWMAVVAGVIFAEKVLPHGVRLSRAVAVALVILGIWVAASPSGVPGLTEPDASPSMEMSP